MRSDGRGNFQLRPVKITKGFLKFAEGSALIEMGDTKVICCASVENRVPFWMKDKGTGWITAEYSMLPRSTMQRTSRERVSVSGRTQEIQRLIGRSLRSVVDLALLGEKTIWIDCDVIQADGGTRTAAITGSMVAMLSAFDFLMKEKVITKMPVTDFISAVSVGILEGEEILDLNYVEDSQAQVDMNLVMTGSSLLVEVQGTAEGKPFSRECMDKLMDMGKKGVNELIDIQRESIPDIIKKYKL
ncbi:MAG: ribonuclease PH [Firmicutes bacterium]|nr:ribonuclease PH [Bacillota bacterium]